MPRGELRLACQSPFNTCALALVCATWAAPSLAQQAIVITATHLPEPQLTTPGTDTLISGQEVRARGALELRSALAPAAGVEVLPGSDAGPAGSVVAMQGLTEQDAYLLVVDGVPYGGAFNPATSTLDLIDIDRIEVVRGAAPVTFGATSFVGVIHVIRPQAGEQPTRALAQYGSHRSGRAAFATTLSKSLLRQSLLGSIERRGFSQEGSKFERGHLLYRAATAVASGQLHFDLDATILNQRPYSSHPREGTGLSDRFPLDANVNPANAAADQDRLQANLGYETRVGTLTWSSLVSGTRMWGKNVRGFLREDFDDGGTVVNADGFRQHTRLTDVYFDSHLSRTSSVVDWVVGVDWLYGKDRQRSENFEYAVLPDGSNAPSSDDLDIDESTTLEDRRSFAGIYAQAIVRPLARLTLLGGVRLSHTAERRCGGEIQGPGTPVADECQTRNKTRVIGSIGASYVLVGNLQSGVAAFVDYKDTYKPAAIDFGPEGEPDILKPEDAHGWEAGLKANLLSNRVQGEVSYFDTRFRNLVIRENINGLPALANAGKERFRGVEAEIRWRLTPALTLGATYAHHLAKFTDFARLRPDGSVQQLAGKRLELSPKNVASAIFVYAPDAGPQASSTVRFVGSRFLNKSNTVRTGRYATLDARIGWKIRNGLTLFLEGENLTDRRDPVTESEIGDAQFYRLPGRRLLATVSLGY